MKGNDGGLNARLNARKAAKQRGEKLASRNISRCTVKTKQDGEKAR
jgi:hypothetical protein